MLKGAEFEGPETEDAEIEGPETEDAKTEGADEAKHNCSDLLPY